MCSRYVIGTCRVEDTHLIIGYERARDTLNIIEGFLDNELNPDADYDADPIHFEVIWNDELETITVLVRGHTYMMEIGSDDDAYVFHLQTENSDQPKTVTIPFREIKTLEWFIDED